MLSRALRRARAASSNDAGISLAELLVAMALATIIGAMTMVTFVNVSDSTAATTDRVIGSSQARNTLQSWTGYLRVADGTTAGSTTNRFEWLTGTDVLFYADLKNRTASADTVTAPTMIWLRLDSASRLVEEQFSSTAAAGAHWTTCRALADSATAPETDLRSGLFTASDTTGATLTPTTIGAGVDLGAAPTASAGCQPLPVTVPSAPIGGVVDPVAVVNLQSVGSVEIAFTMTDTKGKHPLEFDSVATVPTLGSPS
jgi:Tfp pilus assembly protein PilW